MTLTSLLVPNKKISLKWNADRNVRTQTIKLPEENIVENLSNFVLGKDFLNSNNLNYKRNHTRPFALQGTLENCKAGYRAGQNICKTFNKGLFT